MCPVSSAALPFVVLHAVCHFSLLEFHRGGMRGWQRCFFDDPGLFWRALDWSQLNVSFATTRLHVRRVDATYSLLAVWLHAKYT